MECLINIKMDNAAFEEQAGDELSRILRGLAERIENRQAGDFLGIPLRDINGNTVGYFAVTGQEG